jgi:hypothetical protein
MKMLAVPGSAPVSAACAGGTPAFPGLLFSEQLNKELIYLIFIDRLLDYNELFCGNGV